MSVRQTALHLMREGNREALRIYNDVKILGPRKTARREIEEEREYVQNAETTGQTVLRAGQAGGNLVNVMLILVIAAAVAMIGTKVLSELDDSIDVSAGTNYANAKDNISAGFTDAMQLTDIVFLVLMFGVILAALLGFRSVRGG